MEGSNAGRQLAKNIAVPALTSTMRTAGVYRTYRIAATVAPVTVSGGVVRLTAGRFQRATTRITPKKDKVFNRNAAPIPANAITKPASAGPTARAKLNSMPLSADAAGRSSFSTSSGKTARQVGVSNASPADRAKVRMSSSTGDILPAIVIIASATATTTIHISVNRITLRRSTMSPMAPAGRARIKNGRADAVCVRATYIGPALRDTISQAAPTLCINVPTSETTSATSKLRKVDDLRGRHRLPDPSLVEIATASALCFHIISISSGRVPSREHGTAIEGPYQFRMR